jgi:hypothetical protein
MCQSVGLQRVRSVITLTIIGAECDYGLKLAWSTSLWLCEYEALIEKLLNGETESTAEKTALGQLCP